MDVDTPPRPAGTSGPSAPISARMRIAPGSRVGQGALSHGGFASSFVAAMALVPGSHRVHPASGARLWERGGSGERGGAERPGSEEGLEAGDRKGPGTTCPQFPPKARAGRPQRPPRSLPRVSCAEVAALLPPGERGSG